MFSVNATPEKIEKLKSETEIDQKLQELIQFRKD